MVFVDDDCLTVDESRRGVFGALQWIFERESVPELAFGGLRGLC